MARARACEVPGVNRANIILLRLAAAVYPALLAGVIVILTRPHPLPKLIGFLSGGLAISIGAGIAIVKRLVATGALTRSSHSSRPIADSVEIAIGAASLLIAWAIWTGHIKRTRSGANSPPQTRRTSPTSRSEPCHGGRWRWPWPRACC